MDEYQILQKLKNELRNDLPDLNKQISKLVIRAINAKLSDKDHNSYNYGLSSSDYNTDILDLLVPIIVKTIMATMENAANPEN